jgi:pyruvate formate lyase activating enzyme
MRTEADAMVRDSLLQEARHGAIRCNVCERRCVLEDGERGWCQTRSSRGGRLVTLAYGAVSSMAADPVEKKPFYHFHPGSYAFTAGGWSCNFDCPWCQNWSIAKGMPEDARDLVHVPPARFVELAEEAGCQGTSISYNEPTLALEWSLDVFRLARGRGLYNTFVTNGYMTPEALALLVEAGLDAMNVDVKGDAGTVRRYCGKVDVERVWGICRLARERGLHVEVTTLVVPGVNDDETALRDIARRIVAELGAGTPWHVSGYYPAYRFSAPPTPLETLERTWRIGKEAGIEFVYVGNVPGHRYDDTDCPGCGARLVHRRGFAVRENRVQGGRCPQCGRRIPGVWSR